MNTDTMTFEQARWQALQIIEDKQEHLYQLLNKHSPSLVNPTWPELIEAKQAVYSAIGDLLHLNEAQARVSTKK